MAQEPRGIPRAEASMADAVFGIREGDMPVKVREYAHNLHRQVQDIYARLGVTSFADISALSREVSSAHRADIVALQHLLPKLRELLLDPDRTERHVRETENIAWYEILATRLAEQANVAGKIFTDDEGGMASHALGALRFQSANYPDGEAAQEEARERTRESLTELARRMRDGFLGGRISLPGLVVCAYDVGEIDWASGYARESVLANVLAARAKACARADDVLVAIAALQRCCDELAFNTTGRYFILKDVVPVIYAAAVKADDAALQASALSFVSGYVIGMRRDVQTGAFAMVLDEGDFLSAGRIADILGDQGRKYDVLTARQDAGEDVVTELVAHFDAEIAGLDDAFAGLEDALESCAATVRRLRAYPQVALRCFARLESASALPDDAFQQDRAVRACVLAQLAVDIGRDASGYIDSALTEDEREFVDAVTLYRMRRRDEALRHVKEMNDSPEACTKLAAAMARNGDSADVPALLDAALEALRQRHDDATQLEACEVAIALGDEVRVNSFLDIVENGCLAANAEYYTHQLLAAGLSARRVLVALGASVHGAGGGDARTLKSYIQLSAADEETSRGINYIADIDRMNELMGTSVKKATVVQWLWEGAVEAAEKAKRLKKRHGV